MIEFVNAKINLGLNIVSKRNDGYHNLETIFYPVGKHNGTPDNPSAFCDILEITENECDIFKTSGNQIDCPDEKNLVIKARNLFNETLRGKDIIPIKTCIRLEKHLPDAAGLGGGSADATFTLKILNELNHNPFSSEELASIAVQIGADCPFFIYNSPVYAEGIGDIFHPSDKILKGLWTAIVKPAKGISTKEAFSGIAPQIPTQNIRSIINRPITEWKDLLKNDFEKSMFDIYPEMALIKKHLYAGGALYAQMSGSGSAFFGIFDNETDARIAAQTANTPYSAVILL